MIFISSEESFCQLNRITERAVGRRNGKLFRKRKLHYYHCNKGHRVIRVIYVRISRACSFICCRLSTLDKARRLTFVNIRYVFSQITLDRAKCVHPFNENPFRQFFPLGKIRFPPVPSPLIEIIFEIKVMRWRIVKLN